MEWLDQFIRLVHRLFSSSDLKEKDLETPNLEQKHYPVKVLLKVPTPYQLKPFPSIKKPQLFLPPGEQETSDTSGLGSFKPDDLEDEEVAHTYGLIEEIKKTLKRQDANKNKERKAYEKKKKERIAQTKVRAEELRDYFENLQEKPRHYMLCFVMYDIENNRIRTKIAKYLEEKGLKRVQKSVFFGDIDKRVYKQVHEVLTEIQATYENTDSLMLVPVSEDEVKSMKLIGKEVDFEYAIIRKNTLFF